MDSKRDLNREILADPRKISGALAGCTRSCNFRDKWQSLSKISYI